MRLPPVIALVERNPRKAFEALAPKLSKRAREQNPKRAEQILAALARHGDTLPAAWRKLLLEMADEPAHAVSAAVGLAQVKPHRSLVPPMIRRIAARLEAPGNASSDDEIALAVLAKCADERATPVLIRLLEAPRIAHWDLLLAACVATGDPTLVPAIKRWLARARKNGVSPKWDGYAEGRAAVKQLR